MNIDALYSLERALLRYPGLRFEGERTRSPLFELDGVRQPDSVLCFHGPAPEGRTVGCMVPVWDGDDEDELFGERMVESAYAAMVRGVKDAD